MRKRYYDLGKIGTPEYKMAVNFMVMEGTFNRIKEDTSSLYKYVNSEDYKHSIKDAGVTRKLEDSIYNNTKELNHRFEQFQKSAEEQGKFWNYCTESIYRKYFDGFEKVFLKKIPNSTKIDFLKYEINAVCKSGNNDIFTHECELDYTLKVPLEELLLEKFKVNIELERNKKIEFIKNQIESFGYSVKLINKKYEVNKIENLNQTLPLPIDNNSNDKTLLERTNEFPFNIFINLFAFELFNYLDDNYNEKFARAKYINIYRFLLYVDNILICTQLEYIDYIYEIKNIKISKITPETYKYKDTIQPKLTYLKSSFDKSI